MKKTRTPSCNGWNYHVFALGASKCSMCGWVRYAPAPPPPPRPINEVR